MNLKKKIISSLIIFSLIFLFFIFFLIFPSFKEIKNLSRELISKKEEILFLEEKIKKLEEFQKNYKKIKPDLEKIDSLFVEEKMPLEFIDFLKRISKDCQIPIEISTISITKTKEDPWIPIGFQINSFGSFPNFLKFLDKLEASQYLIKIENLNISKLTETEIKSKEFEGASLGDVKILLSIKVYGK